MQEKILEILGDKCGIDVSELKENMDIDLFGEGLLDSFGMLSLLVDFETELGVKLEITELSREEISTPQKVVECVLKRC